jgi:hypothetical protein
MIATCARAAGALVLGISLYAAYSASASPPADAAAPPTDPALTCSAPGAAVTDSLGAATQLSWCGWVGSCYCCDDYCICP